MATKVNVVDANGRVLEAMELPGEFLSLLLGEADTGGLARYIDEYGDTYFNSLQVKDFLSEIAAVRQLSANSDVVGRAASELTRLARLVVEQAHLFLVFEGD